LSLLRKKWILDAGEAATLARCCRHREEQELSIVEERRGGDDDGGRGGGRGLGWWGVERDRADVQGAVVPSIGADLLGSGRT
jgi:hypothetical protein